MEKALTKLGSFTISRKAKQELSAIGGDISVSAHRRRHLSFSVSPFGASGCSSLPVTGIALDPLLSIFILSGPAVLGKLMRLEILPVALHGSWLC